MPVIHLLRHGLVHNPEGVLYGRLPDFRLSDVGEEMARVAAAHLLQEGHDVARVVSSPLLRAQQTAKAVADAFGLAVETDERLIEAGNSFEGERIHPFARFLLRPKRLWSLRNPFRPSWGEPYVDQRHRMMAAIRDAAVAEPRRETVLVSHQLPIWVARLAAEGRRLPHDPRGRQCTVASITSFTVDGDTVTLASYAEPAAHLLVHR